ncbi:MerR family transcriptional regulator [Paenarthrobacter aurescens]|uniref:MerR family transcriptional regulator n=1 Tax=Paenarthrobacter aurescens TaxID=43663 RepID=A0A4Y3NGN3_PAEAU|nr:MerR family transcriptional regulator [Paenarthrobacter aurescens]MDO6143382.1 MerR family transcriptional regulator [Paenarthrobacter aurescens]MDO6147230.1 MerR family transcriptional regulator [Paenarthrobacter aurescens]MDO6158474.1 MerR family transcriptional regulator [Paenarthrobacter aurescens]MDO6162458.1 MerR family transcriptional regulator [Paenarthrobacter aurescens]GEB18201.1 MerR family transcriptional regulator [Paenarthrobacter aurescens]
MKISELAARTGVATRMLRYYEEQGLITPHRLANGYRDYDSYLVDRVTKIRGLVDSGVPTRIIGDILPCLNQSQEIIVRDPDPELRMMLINQRDAMVERIASLEQNRDALTRYIAAMDQALQPTP